MKKAEQVIKAYMQTEILANTLRTGWINWNINKERIESIAEHIYSTQQCALIIYLTYKEKYKDLDISKVLVMLAIHEIEEIFIGDLTLFDISKEEKTKIGHKKVHEFFNQFENGKEFEELIFEFDERKTKEALFAYQCDKIQCDIKAVIYDNENCVDLNNQENNKTFKDKKVQELLNRGLSFGEMWVQFGQDRYNYDEQFMEVSNYIKKMKIK